MHLAPWQWDPQAGRLARIEKIGDRHGMVEVQQSRPGVFAVTWQGLAATDAAGILARVRRWLSADWDPAPAMAALPDAAFLIERGGGRLLRGSSFYEDFVKTVLTINASWSGTCRMAAALVAEPGEGAFPGPAAVLEYGEQRLRERAKLGFRARTVIEATRQMLDGGAITAGGCGNPDRLKYEYLLSLTGIGPYAAAHCRVLLQDFSRIPVDSSVLAYLRGRQGCDPARFAADRASWDVYLALGYRLARLREKLENGTPPESE